MHKKLLYDEIDFLVRESKGAYTFEDAYNMPTYIRKYYINKISEENREVKEQIESQQNKPKEHFGKPKIPKSEPYLTKAGKK